MTFGTSEHDYRKIVKHLQMAYGRLYDLKISSKEIKEQEDFIEKLRTADPLIEVTKYYKGFFDKGVISKERLEELVKERETLLKDKLKELKK